MGYILKLREDIIEWLAKIDMLFTRELIKLTLMKDSNKTQSSSSTYIQVNTRKRM
jgi:hypothetical protein